MIGSPSKRPAVSIVSPKRPYGNVKEPSSNISCFRKVMRCVQSIVRFGLDMFYNSAKKWEVNSACLSGLCYLQWNSQLEEKLSKDVFCGLTYGGQELLVFLTIMAASKVIISTGAPNMVQQYTTAKRIVFFAVIFLSLHQGYRWQKACDPFNSRYELGRIIFQFITGYETPEKREIYAAIWNQCRILGLFMFCVFMQWDKVRIFFYSLSSYFHSSLFQGSEEDARAGLLVKKPYCEIKNTRPTIDRENGFVKNSVHTKKSPTTTGASPRSPLRRQNSSNSRITTNPSGDTLGSIIKRSPSAKSDSLRTATNTTESTCLKKDTAGSREFLLYLIKRALRNREKYKKMIPHIKGIEHSPSHNHRAMLRDALQSRTEINSQVFKEMIKICNSMQAGKVPEDDMLSRFLPLVFQQGCFQITIEQLIKYPKWSIDQLILDCLQQFFLNISIRQNNREGVLEVVLTEMPCSVPVIRKLQALGSTTFTFQDVMLYFLEKIATEKPLSRETISFPIVLHEDVVVALSKLSKNLPKIPTKQQFSFIKWWTEALYAKRRDHPRSILKVCLPLVRSKPSRFFQAPQLVPSKKKEFQAINLGIYRTWLRYIAGRAMVSTLADIKEILHKISLCLSKKQKTPEESVIKSLNKKTPRISGNQKPLEAIEKLCSYAYLENCKNSYVLKFREAPGDLRLLIMDVLHQLQKSQLTIDDFMLYFLAKIEHKLDEKKKFLPIFVSQKIAPLFLLILRLLSNHGVNHQTQFIDWWLTRLEQLKNNSPNAIRTLYQSIEKERPEKFVESSGFPPKIQIPKPSTEEMLCAFLTIFGNWFSYRES